jgi:hypothetical protein
MICYIGEVHDLWRWVSPMRRRDFITAVSALASLATLAQAETYPSRPADCE